MGESIWIKCKTVNHCISSLQHEKAQQIVIKLSKFHNRQRRINTIYMFVTCHIRLPKNSLKIYSKYMAKSVLQSLAAKELHLCVLSSLKMHNFALINCIGRCPMDLSKKLLLNWHILILVIAETEQMEILNRWRC